MDRLADIVKKIKADPEDYIKRRISRNPTYCKLIVLLRNECDKDSITYCSKLASHLGFNQSYIYKMLVELVEFGLIKMDTKSANFSQISLIRNNDKPIIDKYIDLCITVLKKRGLI